MNISRLLSNRNKLTRLPCCENNANNGIIYNATNGNWNNNNKINSNYVLPFLEYDIYDDALLEEYTYPYSHFLQSYIKSRKGKRNRIRRKKYDFMYILDLIDLTHRVNNYEYIPRRCERFVVDENRKAREIISSDVEDCIVYQLWGDEVKEYMNQEIPENSFSCREGKGGLAMMKYMYDMIYNVSLGYVRKCWLFIFDLRKCFMSIDREFAVKDLNKLVDKYITDNNKKELLKYLNRIIFQVSPDEECVTICHPHRMEKIPHEKRMTNAPRGFGLALGKWPSQLYINYSTRRHLEYMRQIHIPCALYTDDTMGIVVDDNAYNPEGYCTKSQLLYMMPGISKNLQNNMHLSIHPNKFYIQPLERGMRCLAYRFIGDKIIPNKTITGNVLYKLKCFIKAANSNNKYIKHHTETIMSVINSYMGILKWCNSNKLKRKVLSKIHRSTLGDMFDIYDNKILLKKIC